MIISASRRTDIPALYAQWFVNRLKEGYFLVPNPRNSTRIGRVDVSPDNVDCIVFWTKNPLPILDKLDEIKELGYSFYFHFTFNPYQETIENNLPTKKELYESFITLSNKIGSNFLIWRYDPIFIDEKHSIEWHIKNFEYMCSKLHRYTKRCMISFIDPYKNIKKNYREMTIDEIKILMESFSKIAKKYEISLYTCAEEIDLTDYNILKGACIDKDIVENLLQCGINAKKDVNQRKECNCLEAVDIGAYDTCLNGCSYCYAISSNKLLQKNINNHDVNAPMLTGYPRGDEIITNRTKESYKDKQLKLF